MKALWIGIAGAVAALGVFGYRRYDALAHSRARSAAATRQQRELAARISEQEARVAASPGDGWARWSLASLLLGSGRPDRAAEQFEALVRLQPDDQAAHLALASARLQAKQLTEAESEYRSQLRRWPESAAAWAGLASALYQQQRFYEALRAARKAVSLGGSEPAHHFILGSAALDYAMQFPDPLLHRRELQLARTELQGLQNSWPDREVVAFRLGLTYLGLKEYENAAGCLHTARSLSTLRADTHRALARALMGAGKQRGAMEAVEGALRTFPNDPSFYFLRGQLAQSSGDTDNGPAVAAFERAVALAPENADFRQQLGAALLRAGRLDTAARELETAARLGSRSASTFQQLASTYSRLDDARRAAEAAARANRMLAEQERLRHLGLLSRSQPDDAAHHLGLAAEYRRLGYAGPAHDEQLLARDLSTGGREHRPEDPLAAARPLRSAAE